MDWKDFNMDKIKVWLELGLALLLVAAIGIAANKGAFTKKAAKAEAAQSAEEKALKKAEAENKAAKSGGAADSSDDTIKADDEKANADKSVRDKDVQDRDAKKEEGTEQTEEVIADGQYPIMGKSSVTAKQMAEYFKSSGETYPTEALSRGGADSIEAFCQLYYEEASAEGVRPEVAFVQTMKETGWLQYGGDASIEQFNFSGLGTTGGGVAGNSYPNVQTGVRAQIQHLKAYATADALTQECVDDRYDYVTKGCAPYVEWLGQQENPEGYGWATGDNYGYAIVEMIANLKKIK